MPPLGVALSTSPADGLLMDTLTCESVGLSESVITAVGSVIATGPALIQFAEVKLMPAPAPFRSTDGGVLTGTEGMILRTASASELVRPRLSVAKKRIVTLDTPGFPVVLSY